MKAFIATGKQFDAAGVESRVAQGSGPRSSLSMLLDRLDATLLDGTGVEANYVDRLLARATRSRSDWWATARQARSCMRLGDIVFCTGEDVGIPVAAVAGGRKCRLTVLVHRGTSRSKLAALSLLVWLGRIDKIVVVSKEQQRILRRFVRDDRVQFLWDQTDTDFFTPGQRAGRNVRPVVATVGLEQRDFTTLVAAAERLGADLHVSGFSADSKGRRSHDALNSATVSTKFYSWLELSSLYQSADVVVVALRANDYAAGVQALLEAMSSGRAAIVSCTRGLRGYIDSSWSVPYAPSDVENLVAAISRVLSEGDWAAEVGRQARARAIQAHSLERYVEDLASIVFGERAPSS